MRLNLQNIEEYLKSKPKTSKPLVGITKETFSHSIVKKLKHHPRIFLYCQHFWYWVDIYLLSNNFLYCIILQVNPSNANVEIFQHEKFHLIILAAWLLDEGQILSYLISCQARYWEFASLLILKHYDRESKVKALNQRDIWKSHQCKIGIGSILQQPK